MSTEVGSRSFVGRWLTKAATYVVARGLPLSDPRLAQMLAGGESHAGKAVTVDTALQISTAYACIRLISQTWGTLPVEIKLWNGKSSEPTRDHPLYALLHDSPNADMSAVEFWSAMGVCLLTWGNAYAEIQRVLGRVVAITPLNPQLVSPLRASSGAIVYRYSDPKGMRELGEDEVLHIKGLSSTGLVGMSPVGQARHSLGLAMAVEETAGKLFANGMRAPGYLSSPTYLTTEQRQQAREMIARYSGAQNAGRTPLLEGGWKYESIALPPQEAELLATRAFSVEEICRWYGVPPYMVGHTEKSTSWGTGIEQQMLTFYTLTLRPILKNAEHAIRRRLLAPEERGKVEVDFNIEGLLRADSAGRAAFLKAMVECGIMTRNEARAREGLPPKQGGDDLTVQSQNVSVGMIGHNGGPRLEADA